MQSLNPHPPFISSKRDNINQRSHNIRNNTPNESDDDDEIDEKEDDEPIVSFDMSEIRKAKLPNKLIIMKNADKEWHEKNYPGRCPIDIVHPFRLLCAGVPNTGKSNVVRNILMRQGMGENNPFEEVIVIHCDSANTKEYSDIQCTMLDENSIPAPDEFRGEVKTLVVLEDLSFEDLKHADKKKIDRLYSYVSTHKNISVICCAQNFTSIPTYVRRCSNFFILWKSPDMISMASVAKKTGLDKGQLTDIFNRLMPNFHDSLWINLTEGAPHKLYKNGFQPIKMND